MMVVLVGYVRMAPGKTARDGNENGRLSMNGPNKFALLYEFFSRKYFIVPRLPQTRKKIAESRSRLGHLGRGIYEVALM